MTNFFIVPNEVFDLNLKPQQFAVLCYILKCCDESNTCYPSIHTIAEACAISDNTVRESIKFLCKRKIITKSGGFTVGKYGKIQSSSYLFSINPNFMTKVSAGTTLSNITNTKTLPPHNLQRHTLRISLHTPCKILHPPTSNITPMGFKICTCPLQNLNPSPSDFEGDYFRI